MRLPVGNPYHGNSFRICQWSVYQIYNIARFVVMPLVPFKIIHICGQAQSVVPRPRCSHRGCLYIHRIAYIQALPHTILSQAAAAASSTRAMRYVNNT